MDQSQKYRKACLKLALILLAIWFTVSFGCGILLRDWLDAFVPNIGNAPFGFWMAQQGAILSFIVLLIIYACAMNRLDAKYGYKEDELSPSDKSNDG